MRPNQRILLLPVVLMLSALSIHAESFEYEWQAGCDFESAYDTNPALLPDSSDKDPESYVISLIPHGSLKVKNSYAYLQITGRYLSENYPETDEFNDQNSFNLETVWRSDYSNLISYFASGSLAQSGFGPENLDLPDYRGRSQINEFRPGMEWHWDQHARLSASAIWKMKDYQGFESDGVYGSAFGMDWNDYGMEVRGNYAFIPEFEFLSSLVWRLREFDDYDPVPGHNRTDGAFGFKVILPEGSTIAAQAHLHHVKFDGEVPRHMNSNYTNYGMSLESIHPLTPGLLLRLDAFSVFDISERGPRMLYHDRGVLAGISYEINADLTTELTYEYHKLEYNGQEPLLSSRTQNFSAQIKYRLMEWLTVGSSYQYYTYDEAIPDEFSERHRIAIRAGFSVPSP